MDEKEFRQFLRRQGKKAHVVAALVKQAPQFAAYLAEEKAKTLETAVRGDIVPF